MVRSPRPMVWALLGLMSAGTAACEPKAEPARPRLGEVRQGATGVGIPTWEHCNTCMSLAATPHGMARGPGDSIVLTPSTWAFYAFDAVGGAQSSGSWTQHHQPGKSLFVTPGGQYGIAYHDSEQLTLLFGGRSANLALIPPDLWSLAAGALEDGGGGGGWQILATASGSKPSARSAHAMAYDGQGSIVLYGGVDASGALLSDTWLLRNTNNTWSWELKSSASAPGKRSHAAMMLDPLSGHVLLFGGKQGVLATAETWEFDGTSWLPGCGSSPGACGFPSAGGIHTHAGATDPHRKRALAFGGRGIEVGLPDSGASACNAPVYEWQGTQWHRYCAIGKAPNFTNRFVAAAYDVVGRRMVVNIDGDETWFFTALATPCATGDDCNGTQYCAAGSKICCNEPCDASCATCNPDTGECEIVAADQSAPGKDPCSPADAEFCEKTRCDGMSVHCQLAHAGESCRSDTCADGGFTAGASCTQFGVCPEPDPSACNGYLCAPNQEKCATSCDGECAPDYCCIGGSCTFCAPTCSDAGNQVVSADGGTLSCGAYACVDGACVSSCVANADCASEHVCVKGGACRKLFDEQPDEDPCSCRVVGERRPLSTGFAALALALFALSLRRRRRRDPRSAARAAPSCGARNAD